MTVGTTQPSPTQRSRPLWSSDLRPAVRGTARGGRRGLEPPRPEGTLAPEASASAIPPLAQNDCGSLSRDPPAPNRAERRRHHRAPGKSSMNWVNPESGRCPAGLSPASADIMAKTVQPRGGSRGAIEVGGPMGNQRVWLNASSACSGRRGDAFARVFGGPIVPQEIESLLRREASDGVRRLAGERFWLPTTTSLPSVRPTTTT